MDQNYISQEDRKFLEKVFAEGAAKLEPENECWIHGADEGISYCWDCAEKEMAMLQKENPDKEYFLSSSDSSEGDGIATCECCGKVLENCLTSYGCEYEVDHFLEYGFTPENPDDCHSMERVIEGRSWEPWAEQVYRDEYEHKSDLAYFDSLHQLCRGILEQIRKN